MLIAAAVASVARKRVNRRDGWHDTAPPLPWPGAPVPQQPSRAEPSLASSGRSDNFILSFISDLARSVAVSCSPPPRGRDDDRRCLRFSLLMWLQAPPQTQVAADNRLVGNNIPDPTTTPIFTPCSARPTGPVAAGLVNPFIFEMSFETSVLVIFSLKC